MVEFELRAEHEGKKIVLTAQVDVAPDAPYAMMLEKTAPFRDALVGALASVWVTDALKRMSGEPLLERLAALGYSDEVARRLAESK